MNNNINKYGVPSPSTEALRDQQGTKLTVPFSALNNAVFGTSAVKWAGGTVTVPLTLTTVTTDFTHILFAMATPVSANKVVAVSIDQCYLKVYLNTVSGVGASGDVMWFAISDDPV